MRKYKLKEYTHELPRNDIYESQVFKDIEKQHEIENKYYYDLDALKKKLSDDFSDCEICIEEYRRDFLKTIHRHMCITDLTETIKRSEEVGYYQPMIRVLTVIPYGDFEVSHCQECKKVFILIPKLQPIPKGCD